MTEVLSGFPPTVAAFKVTDKVTKDDYEKIIIPLVDKIAKEFKKVNFLLQLDTDMSNYSIGAWVDDILLGIKHIAHWHRVAIVSHHDIVKKITDVFGHLVPGEYRGFRMEDMSEATKWVSEV